MSIVYSVCDAGVGGRIAKRSHEVKDNMQLDIMLVIQWSKMFYLSEKVKVLNNKDLYTGLVKIHGLCMFSNHSKSIVCGHCPKIVDIAAVASVASRRIASPIPNWCIILSYSSSRLVTNRSWRAQSVLLFNL